MAQPLRAGLDQRTLRRFDVLQLLGGDFVGVAFSGGTDSLALALSLSRVAPRLDVHTHLIHVDHGLRASSATDAARCRALASELDLPITVITLPEGLADRSAISGIEQQARLERYCTLQTVIRDLGASIVATGHHRGDQAETVLLHLFRGSGLKGAAAMSELSTWPVECDAQDNEQSPQLWRPFLSESRSALAAYVQPSGLIPLHDPSNDDLGFRRNAVRHDILPVVERHFPGSEATLARFASIVTEDAAYLDVVASDITKAVESVDGGLELAAILKLPLALSTRTVYQWMKSRGVGDVTHERVLEVLAFVRESSEEQHLEAGSERWVIRDGEHLRCDTSTALIEFLARRHALLSVLNDRFEEGSPVLQPNGDRIRCGDWWLEIVGNRESRSMVTENTLTFTFPESVTHPQLRLRCTRPGDEWFDTGEPLREVLRRSGVHPLVRWSIICAATGHKVHAIPGIRDHASQERRAQTGEVHQFTLRWGRWEQAE